MRDNFETAFNMDEIGERLLLDWTPPSTDSTILRYSLSIAPRVLGGTWSCRRRRGIRAASPRTAPKRFAATSANRVRAGRRRREPTAHKGCRSRYYLVPCGYFSP